MENGNASTCHTRVTRGGVVSAGRDDGLEHKRGRYGLLCPKGSGFMIYIWYSKA